MYFKAGRLHRQGHDPKINGPVFDALQNLVAEIAIDADLHIWIRAMELGENLGQDVEAGGFICSDGKNAAGHLGLVGDGPQRFLPQV